jgi:hypothetical protein
MRPFYWQVHRTRRTRHRHVVEITDLDDFAVRERVQASPSDAVRGPSPVCID